MKKITSAYANKWLKSLEEDKEYWVNKHNAAESDPEATWNENAENTALLAEYALDFAILAADRALLLSLKAIQEQKEAIKIELQQNNLV